MQVIDAKIDELKSLCMANPDQIPIGKLADWLGCAPETLRRSIDSGNCPFGFLSRIDGAKRSSYIIPTVTVWTWLIKK